MSMLLLCISRTIIIIIIIIIFLLSYWFGTVWLAMSNMISNARTHSHAYILISHMQTSTNPPTWKFHTSKKFNNITTWLPNVVWIVICCYLSCFSIIGSVFFTLFHSNFILLVVSSLTHFDQCDIYVYLFLFVVNFYAWRVFFFIYLASCTVILRVFI